MVQTRTLFVYSTKCDDKSVEFAWDSNLGLQAGSHRQINWATVAPNYVPITAVMSVSTAILYLIKDTAIVLVYGCR